MHREHIRFDGVKLAAFCARWQVAELSLFGSVIRDDFTPTSDVDVLVAFAPGAAWSYWEWPEMIDELQAIFHRRVDLVEKKAITNPFRRHRILTTRKVVYAAA